MEIINKEKSIYFYIIISIYFEIIIIIKELNGLKSIYYAPTPIMSTYLVALVIGEFDFIEGKTKGFLNIF